MNQIQIEYRLCFKHLDQEKLEDFLWTQREDLFLPDRESAKKIIELVFEKGGILAGFDSSNEIQAMFGFFFGDPSEKFANKDIMFVYVAAVSQSLQLSRAFLSGIATLAKEGARVKIDQFRMHASTSNRYINKLYSKFSTPIGESKNLRGYPVMVYEGSVESVFERMGPRLRTAFTN